MRGGPDLVLALSAVALGIAYFLGARALPVSLLSDAVGPGGLPAIIAVVMALSGAALALRALRAAPVAAAEEDAPAHGRALGLLAILVGYVALLPLLGYPLAIGLFAALVAAYAGARRPLTILAFGAGTAAVLWLSFVAALGIGLPAGRLFAGA